MLIFILHPFLHVSHPIERAENEGKLGGLKHTQPNFNIIYTQFKWARD